MRSSVISIRLALMVIVWVLLYRTAVAQQVGDTIVQNNFCYRVLDGCSVELVAHGETPYQVETAVIPPYVVGDGGSRFAVTSIGSAAFAGSQALMAVSLPVTLHNINDSAFAGCTALGGSIVLPHGFSVLGPAAFARCKHLRSLSLPASVVTIGDEALAGCKSLGYVFSQTTNVPAVVDNLPAGARLCVPASLVDDYRDYCDRDITVLVNVDDEPRSANLCDVNHDGVITAADVTQVYDNLLGYDEAIGDANGDGTVTAADVTTIYDALLCGSACGVGDKGYCFVSCDGLTGDATMRVWDALTLPVGGDMCIAAHDNERQCLVPSGFNIMSGAVPGATLNILPDGSYTHIIDNKSYNTGTTTPVVMYFAQGADTIYYKDVTVNVARHLVTDTLRVLSIGNSFSLDALSYVPFIMKAVAPQVYLKLGIMYIGGGSLENFCNALGDNSFRYYWSHGARPWDERVGVAMTETITSEPWDVIVLQQQSNKSRDYSTYQPYLNQLIDWIEARATWPHEVAWLITPSYPDNLPRLAPDTTSVQMFERILDCVVQVQADTGIELLLPCGTAIQNARTTPLDSLGDQGHLFDYLHLQEGIPCLIEAYTATAALLSRYSLSDAVWTDTTWIDQQWLRAKNIQEINGTPVGMSEENRAIAKQCAIKALENPLSITQIE